VGEAVDVPPTVGSEVGEAVDVPPTVGSEVGEALEPMVGTSVGASVCWTGSPGQLQPAQSQLYWLSNVAQVIP